MAKNAQKKPKNSKIFRKNFFIVIDLEWFKTYFKTKICVYDGLKNPQKYFKNFDQKNFSTQNFRKPSFLAIMVESSINLVSLQSSIDIGKCTIAQSDRNTTLSHGRKKFQNILPQKFTNRF